MRADGPVRPWLKRPLTVSTFVHVAHHTLLLGRSQLVTTNRFLVTTNSFLVTTNRYYNSGSIIAASNMCGSIRTETALDRSD